MRDALKPQVKALKAKTETSRARIEALLAIAKRHKSGTIYEAISASTNDFSITRCMIALQTNDLLDNSKYLKAIEKFTTLKWKEIFMNMPNGRKRAWLIGFKYECAWMYNCYDDIVICTIISVLVTLFYCIIQHFIV